MVKYEYQKIVGNFKEVQKLGLEGWELVAVSGGGLYTDPTYYLKRAIIS